MGAAVPPLPH